MSAGRGAASLAVTTLVAGLLAVSGAPPAAATPSDCLEVQLDSTNTAAPALSVPFQSMQMGRAQELALPGSTAPAIGVAVVDSGISGQSTIPVQGEQLRAAGVGAETVSGHGTAAAGLVASTLRQGATDSGTAPPVGFAPGAALFDIKVYDQPDGGGDDSVSTPSAGALAQGLGEIAANPDIQIVLVPFAVEPAPELEAAVAQVVGAGKLLIAAAGNRPQSEEVDQFDQFLYPEGRPPGEDAAGQVAPAMYDGVLAVGASGDVGEDVSGAVLLSSDIDVAAPTAGGVSVGVNGTTCTLPEISTDWAAAQVAGVAALVWTARGLDEPAAQIRERIIATASGGRARSRTLGAGVVQPVDALQRPLRFNKSGAPIGSEPEGRETERAEPPRPPADVLASVRGNAVWWGLFGGGALVVVMLLRPVLARRRPN